TSGKMTYTTATAGGLLFLAPLLMIVFRQKYSRWWFDWNLELLRFGNRVGTYLALMNDGYPSTDEHQWVHLDYPYPDAERDLNRWLPLVRCCVPLPPYFVFFFVDWGMGGIVFGAWSPFLFGGPSPRGVFAFVRGVTRGHIGVVASAFVLVPAGSPPFSLQP